MRGSVTRIFRQTSLVKSVRAGCNGRNVSPSHITALFAENNLRDMPYAFDDIFSSLRSPLGDWHAARIFQDEGF